MKDDPPISLKMHLVRPLPPVGGSIIAKIIIKDIIGGLLFLMAFQAYSFEEPKDKSCFIDFDGQKHCLVAPKNREVCCRLTYPDGGYDFVITNEKNCRASEYFSGFLKLDNPLCVTCNEEEEK